MGAAQSPAPPLAGARDALSAFVPWGLASFALFLVLLCHLPLRHADYVQDDHPLVENNPVVARGNLREIFTSSYWAGAPGDARTLYRPLPILTYALERKLWGTSSPALSHMVNLLLHGAATLLLLAWVRRLGADAATTTATTLLFAVHPAHVEALANIVGRAELLAALLTLLALWSFSYSGAWELAPGGAAPGSGRRRLAAWGAGLCLLAALLSKEVALAGLPLMLALTWVYRPAHRRPLVERLGSWLPPLLALLTYFALRVVALERWLVAQHPPTMDNPLVALDGLSRLTAALSLLGRYVALLLYPGHLSADYSGQVIPLPRGLADPWTVGGLLVLLLLLLLACQRLFPRSTDARARRLLAAGAWMFLLPYAIVGNLLVPIGTIFAERVVYLPSTGFCLLLGWIIGALARGLPFSERLPRSRWRVAFFLVLGLLVAAHGIRSHARALEWRDDATLFAATLATHPDSPRALFIVGRQLAEEGRYAQAIEHFERLLQLYPDHPSAAHEKGIALARLGRPAQAAAAFHEALRLLPQSARAHVNLALALRQAGRPAAARIALRKALACDVRDARAWAELGNLEMEQRHYRAAAAAYRRARELGREEVLARLQQAERAAAEDDSPRGPGR